MNDNKWCYCKHSETKVKHADVVTWCNKHDTWIFRDDAVLCDGCKVFECDSIRKAEYVENWSVIAKPEVYEEISVFTENGFYRTIERRVTK